QFNPQFNCQYFPQLYLEHEDFLLSQTINNDQLKQWERERRKMAEKTILTAAKIISPAIASTYAEGHAWCVEITKESVYASLAMELEMNKAIDMLRNGDIEAASQALMVFNNKDSKIASIAANNLAVLYFLQGSTKYDEAVEFCEQSLNIDRYNPNALVNRGNIYFAKNDYEKAFQSYREALSNEATCVQALYNMGLVAKHEGRLDEALDYFYKACNIAFGDVQVLCQLASIYEMMGDNSQALELYGQASNLMPTDPSISAKLASIYESEGDKTQAFQCYYESYRYFPSNISIIEWFGAYYIETQFPEKAVAYFAKAAIMQPNEIRWQLMMASCERRAGNYQKALDLYKAVHRRFPENIECLKFLARICTDLGIPEAKDYKKSLIKAENLRQLRQQRATDSSHSQRKLINSAPNEPLPTSRKYCLNSIFNIF
uniref:TPR_REGION domain-containing protein n=1 Tax=Syphacia muris TaxID=451379 RepID=A0A0N5B0Z6_9BILA